ncbi:LytTR family DNA-binding domain-containing protein [Sphingosinicella terrae]|uniref:LytTR family DNA-binding domain-containing protein n=1 Tax=Sphingosinicella terrae TaxID=2172047 RepID=UPI000E0D0DD9|nr:LytTR family DNA-binding domain-containing protein [Sphingosinicella terrae]
MTSGILGGTSGPALPPHWRVAYVIIAVSMVLIGTVNVLSVLDERSWMGRPIDWWEPAVWEGSSGIVLLALAWIPGRAVHAFPPYGPKAARHLAIHVALTIGFSLAHVALMIVLRHGAYMLAGERYAFGSDWDPWLYEYRKDFISYGLYAGIFWLAARVMGDRPPTLADPGAGPAPDEAGIVIDEGQRVLKVAPPEVLAARSSGNYVEYWLADGRRPLMRATLAGAEEALASKGFVRTHRSWLVNARHVAAIEAEGSGDYGLTLTDGSRIPLSRRYRPALETLRRR